MFFIATQLSDDELVSTIEEMQTSQGRKKDNAFSKLMESFYPICRKLFYSVVSVAQTQEERNEIQNFINKQLWKILIEVRTQKHPGQIKRFIEDILKKRVNKNHVEKELGKDSPIKTLRNYDSFLDSKLRDYKKKYKTMPNFNDPRDIENLAELTGIGYEKTLKLINSVSPHIVKNLFDTIGGGDDDDSVSTLFESIQSSEPIPDQVLMNKEVKEQLEKVISTLSPDEQKVFKLYYLENETNETKEKLAEDMDIPYKRFIYYLTKGVNKVKNSPEMKRLYEANLTNRIIKLTKNKYEIVKIGSRYQLMKVSRSSENLIHEILAGKRVKLFWASQPEMIKNKIVFEIRTNSKVEELPNKAIIDVMSKEWKDEPWNAKVVKKETVNIEWQDITTKDTQKGTKMFRVSIPWKKGFAGALYFSPELGGYIPTISS